MAVGATFQNSPGADPIGAVQSYMQRAQNMRIQQQEADQEKAKFQAFIPAIIAKRNADVATAHASIQNAALMEGLRTKAAANSADYNDRFLNILSIPDDKERSDTLGAFMGEVSWLDNPAIPEYQGFARTVKEERAKAFTQAFTNLKLDQHLQEAEETGRSRVEAALAAADAKKANAQTYSSSRERIAQINSDTKLSLADKAAAKQGVQIEDLQRRATEADQAAADAQAEGNARAAEAHRQAAATYRDALQKTTTFSGSTPSAPRNASQDPLPTPKSSTPPHPPMDLSALPNNGVPERAQTTSPAVAPAKVSKDATTIKVGDKEYQLFKDVHGNRAYKVDGHFVPVQTD